MLRKVRSTKYSDMRTPRGGWREGIQLKLECGHHVYRYHNVRRSYTQARCEWCELEQRDGVRYVFNSNPSRTGVDAPCFIPDPDQPLKASAPSNDTGA